MKCNIYKEQIIEDVYNLTPEAKIHIKECYECKKKYEEYVRFERFMNITKKNLLPPAPVGLQPQYVINLASIKKTIQKNLSSMKRLYVYATIILIIFIYAIIFNTFNHIDKESVTLGEYHQSIAMQLDNEGELKFLEEMEKSDEVFLEEIIDFIDKYT